VKWNFAAYLVVACNRHELKFLHSLPVQSSEQQELSKIRELRRALADKRRLAEQSRIKSMAAPARTAVCPAQPLTEPIGFQFATDDRLKTHGMETRQDVGHYKETQFATDLRHYAPQVRTLPLTSCFARVLLSTVASLLMEIDSHYYRGRGCSPFSVPYSQFPNSFGFFVYRYFDCYISYGDGLKVTSSRRTLASLP